MQCTAITLRNAVRIWLMLCSIMNTVVTTEKIVTISPNPDLQSA